MTILDKELIEKAKKQGIYIKFPDTDYFFCKVEFIFNISDEIYMFVEDEYKIGLMINLKWYKDRWAFSKDEFDEKLIRKFDDIYKS